MHTPLVLDIKCNSLDDGYGVRTVIFFKGCPLSCIWCHNPESKKVNAELSYSVSDCIGCGTCKTVCDSNALSTANPYYVDRTKCTLCYKCTEVCPTNAISKVGTEYTIDQLLDKILSDKVFYDISNGGVTVSGGEATVYPEFVGTLLKRCKEAGVKTLLETCGFFNYEKVEKFMLPYLDDIFFDLKIFDREQHKRYCGTYNDVILENFKRLLNDSKKYGFTLFPRTPLIPDITDTDENLTSIANFLVSLGVKKSKLLPYNPTWYPKTAKLGLDEPKELSKYKGFQTPEKIQHCKQIYIERNIDV